MYNMKTHLPAWSAIHEAAKEPIMPPTRKIETIEENSKFKRSSLSVTYGSHVVLHHLTISCKKTILSTRYFQNLTFFIDSDLNYVNKHLQHLLSLCSLYNI